MASYLTLVPSLAQRPRIRISAGRSLGVAPGPSFSVEPVKLARPAICMKRQRNRNQYPGRTAPCAWLIPLAKILKIERVLVLEFEFEDDW